MDNDLLFQFREMMLALIEDFKKVYRENLTRQAVISTFGEELAQQVQSLYEEVMERDRFSEQISAKFLPLIDFAIQGLDDEEAQELLERVRKAVEEQKKRGLN